MQKNTSWSRRLSVACWGLMAVLGLHSLAQAVDETITGDLTLQSATPELIFDDTGGTPYRWRIRADDISFDLHDVNNSQGDTTPFVIDADAQVFSLFIHHSAGVGVGTPQPNTVGSATLPSGWALNLDAIGVGATGVARFVAQGPGGAETYLVHNGGVSGRKVVRTRVAGGKYLISTMSDNLASNTEIPFSIDLGTKNVGIKTASPTKPLQVGDAGANDGNGAHVTIAGVWTDASSRTLKDDIQPITSEQARDTVRALQPVGYRYKNEPDEKYVGFIAEDVPELVATNDRKSLAAMDITAVLTRVVQDQDRQLEEQRAINKALMERLAKLEQKLAE